MPFECQCAGNFGGGRCETDLCENVNCGDHGECAKGICVDLCASVSTWVRSDDSRLRVPGQRGWTRNGAGSYHPLSVDDNGHVYPPTCTSGYYWDHGGGACEYAFFPDGYTHASSSTCVANSVGDHCGWPSYGTPTQWPSSWYGLLS
eukprot:SAG31_NODE_8779_length_1388_cov_10.356090_2_plen_147_part_00